MGVIPSFLTGLADHWRIRIQNDLRRFDRTPVVGMYPMVVAGRRTVIKTIRADLAYEAQVVDQAALEGILSRHRTTGIHLTDYHIVGYTIC